MLLMFIKQRYHKQKNIIVTYVHKVLHFVFIHLIKFWNSGISFIYLNICVFEFSKFCLYRLIEVSGYKIVTTIRDVTDDIYLTAFMWQSTCTTLKCVTVLYPTVLRALASHSSTLQRLVYVYIPNTLLGWNL